MGQLSKRLTRLLMISRLRKDRGLHFAYFTFNLFTAHILNTRAVWSVLIPLPLVAPEPLHNLAGTTSFHLRAAMARRTCIEFYKSTS